jgi:hypothetical protein
MKSKLKIMRWTVVALLMFTTMMTYAQGKGDQWSLFAKTKFEPKYVEDIKEYIFAPTFPQELKSLEGKEITIEGFYVPFAPEGESFIILSKYPQSQCFFCGGGGPESVAEVKFAKDPPRFKTDDLITVKGKLKLNATDLEHMNFIITDAVLISK